MNNKLVNRGCGYTWLEQARVAWLRKHLHRILRRTRPKLAVGSLRRGSASHVHQADMCAANAAVWVRVYVRVCVPAAIG